MNKRNALVLLLCLFVIFTLTSCGKITEQPMTKYVDIHDIVKEAFVTDNGYTNELSKHITKTVFQSTNYKRYRVNGPEFTKPLKIDFSLEEVYQTKDNKNNLIYVDMIYSIEVTDANGKTVGGSWDIPITYTVKIDKNGWCIINKHELP